MSSFLLRIDDLLRGEARFARVLATRRTAHHLVSCIILFSFLYGGVMGSFGAGGERIWQVLFSALKMPLLLGVTFSLSLPSFFVLYTLVGLRADFAEALQALLAAQAGLAVVLASLAPFTLLWYASSADYQSAILFNACMFAVASCSAQWMLRRYYRPLLARDERHRWMLRLWLVLHGFIGIQMAWMLRPFVGDPNAPTGFFRAGGWGNAYEVVAHMLWHSVAR